MFRHLLAGGEHQNIAGAPAVKVIIDFTIEDGDCSGRTKVEQDVEELWRSLHAAERRDRPRSINCRPGPGVAWVAAGSAGTAFARIRGYLSSLSKQGVKRLAALETRFLGQPLYPSFA
jgi:hypothetical protein